MGELLGEMEKTRGESLSIHHPSGLKLIRKEEEVWIIGESFFFVVLWVLSAEEEEEEESREESAQLPCHSLDPP